MHLKLEDFVDKNGLLVIVEDVSGSELMMGREYPSGWI
jgi:hypothetical protein